MVLREIDRRLSPDAWALTPEVKDVKRTDHQSGKPADQESLQEFLKVALAREQGSIR